MPESQQSAGRPRTTDRRVSVNVSEETYVWLGHVARVCGKSRSWAANAALKAFRETPISDAEIGEIIHRNTSSREHNDGKR